MFILLCVLSLWPVILGWTHILYQVLLYTALAGLVFILVRRVRRFSQARNDADR
jgi:Flp pilus assembly protein protease CpaA